MRGGRPGDSPAATNLALAHRLRAAATAVVSDLDAQIRDNVSRPRLNFRDTGVTAEDRQAIHPGGIVVSRFRQTTILQLIARDETGKILTGVEAHSPDLRAPDTDDWARGAIRQIRTGVLLWNDSGAERGQPRSYATAYAAPGTKPFVLARTSETSTETWTLRSDWHASDSIDYPTFDDAILDIGRHLDARIEAERARRLRNFNATLSPEDREWAADLARTLTSRTPTRRDFPGTDLGR